MILKREIRWLVTAVLAAAGIGLLARPAQAGPTNVIWEASASGSLGIQSFGLKTEPKLQSARFKTSDLVRILLGQTSGSNGVLAVGMDLLPTGTNFYMTVFSKDSRQSLVPRNATDRTTIISDGKNLVFSFDTSLPAPVGLAAGGQLRIAGKGKVVAGVPAALKANIAGFLIDARPSDLGGTTSLVLRATLSTSGAPLRVQPAAGQ
jgi:hypothetical protein